MINPNETNAGIYEDKKPYDGNIVLNEGKYYMRDYTVLFQSLRGSMWKQFKGDLKL